MREIAVQRLLEIKARYTKNQTEQSAGRSDDFDRYAFLELCSCFTWIE